MTGQQKTPLTEQLQSLDMGKPNTYPLFSLFLQDYFGGVRDCSGMVYFDSVYGCSFRKYDPHSNVLLAEMVDNTLDFATETKNELIYEMLVEPYVFLYLKKEKESDNEVL